MLFTVVVVNCSPKGHSHSLLLLFIVIVVYCSFHVLFIVIVIIFVFVSVVAHYCRLTEVYVGGAHARRYRTMPCFSAALRHGSVLLVCLLFQWLFVVCLFVVWSSKRPKTTLLFVVGLLCVLLLMALLFVCYKRFFSTTSPHSVCFHGQIYSNGCSGAAAET